ncbi:g13374 [Coccomyxa viridis]|uniref:G13374 protein n=1 Tax=Coccomyxa viridis TaxID=1274662 RepID=A0ABP1GF95_9CHLO
MSEYEYTPHHSSPFIAALKQSYRKSLAKVHQATLNLHARQTNTSGRSYSDKVCRAIKHVKIFALLTAGLFVAMAPWALAALEVAVMTALYVVLIPRTGTRPWRHIREYHYEFSTSLEDILIGTYIRFLGVLLAYLLGSGPRMMRPYLFAAVGFAAVNIPFLVVKAAYALRQQPWVPAAILIAASAFFTLAHLGTARNMVLWARRRYELGLMGYGFPWEEGEASRLYQGQRNKEQQLLLPQHQPPEPELLPQDLADDDSLFTSVNGVSVHYKLMHPEEVRLPGCGIVLLHPFAGGVFSFRLIMGTLAEDVGCPVLSFDRPGAGLTSRPSGTTPSIDSPYAPDFASDIAQSLCEQHNIQHVIFVGQADGSAIAVLAAAKTQSEEADGSKLKAAGLVLLHPINLEEGESGSSFFRLLNNSRIGRQLLLRMLRADGPNRGAWADPSRMTPEIVDIYRRPAKLLNWGSALIQVTRSKVGRARMQQYLRNVQGVPLLIVTGAKDRITTPQHAAAICNNLLQECTCMILPGVGHLSNEEAPRLLNACLATFCKHTFASLKRVSGEEEV